MSSQLFSSLTLGRQALSNRIVVSPMCQYSAHDGCASQWQLKHLATLAGSGAGLVLIEATGVLRSGRITHGCMGLYSDENELALGQVLAFCRQAGAARFGIQLNYSGRKGSSQVPWLGGQPLSAAEDAWQTLSSSDTPDGRSRACTHEDLARIKQAFVAAAQRAVRLGIDVIELHGAHGYLLHQFLSPLSNRRTDEYGGALDNRMRYPLEVFEAVRKAIPPSVTLGLRLSATDWLPDGLTLEESTVFVQALESLGCDFVDISSGGIAPAKIALEPGYQVPLASHIKAAVSIPVIAVGLILTAEQAEDILARGQADAVALGRAFLHNPHWAYQAALDLGEVAHYPVQYERVSPAKWAGGLVPASR